MEISEIIALAKDCGFDHAAPLDVRTLRLLPEGRDMCAADRCHTYNKTWNCPPGAGSLEELRERCARYSAGLLVQTVGTREDEFDFEAITETNKRHEANFQRLTKALKERLPALLPMGLAACRRCDKCTWPDEPCRFPEEVFPPMEAYGLYVSQVCKDNNMKYYYGKDCISFTSCYLFNLD
jgi:predicted metal-binding protein